jgi:hypothetical protein
VNRFAALLLLTASCSSAPPSQNEVARKSFEEWAKAAIAGDAEKTLAGFSDARKSEWLFERLEENDAIARRWRGELTGPARTDLDLWWGLAHKSGNGREPLRATVLDHPSFAKLFREYFMQTLQTIKAQLSRLEISNIYGDETGITVSVKSGPGAPTELYGLIYERDGWKIDTYRQPLGSPR